MAILVGVGCGPIGPFAGGRLRGEVIESSWNDWSPYASLERAQLETRPDDPYSVHTWFAALGPHLYVTTSMISGERDPGKRSWVAHVNADPRVRIRLGDAVWERRARFVRDAGEYEAARRVLEGKYGLDPVDRDPEREVWIYRLDPARD